MCVCSKMIFQQFLCCVVMAMVWVPQSHTMHVLVTVPTLRINSTAADGTCPCQSQLATARRYMADKVSLALVAGLTEANPAASCGAITNKRSGDYWILPVTGPPAVQVFCDFNRRCGCTGPSTWTRVAFLNMSDPNHNCPRNWTTVNTINLSSPLQICGRGLSTGKGCNSTFFSTFGTKYNRVCGRIVGYQHGSTDAFHRLIKYDRINIDEAYLDGVSVTHGRRCREHIWSFAGAHGEATYPHQYFSQKSVCKCSSNVSLWDYSMSFIGNDYFCDSGNKHRSVTSGHFYHDDPLWDGKGCGPYSSCCQFNSPPWFCKTLPESTTDDLEVRICHSNVNEDTPIQHIELYVQ